MVSRSPLLIVALLSMAFAGCVGDDSQPPGAEPSVAAGPADYDESTGGIDGYVTDEELAPIAGALVGILGLPDAEATTDASGRFALSNVPPGVHSLATQKLGYESSTQKVEVASGQSSEVKITLVVLAVEEPYPETIIFNGIIENGVGVVRTATCTSCPVDDNNKKTVARLPGGKLPKDYAGIMIESTWKSRDYIGIDVLDRQSSVNELYWRIRSGPGVHFLLEKCASYIGAPYFGRSQMPCLDDNVSASRLHIENWYIGEYQQETHNLDEVCKTPIGAPGSAPVVGGYPAGCYGLGFVPELRFTNYITVFHVELPSDAETQSFMPDA
jgi:hypothetical protein